MNFINLILLISIYSFIGWIIETIYASVKERKFINRGFLTGPFCMIYGFSSALIIASSELINVTITKYYLFLIISFFVGAVLVTLVELITGLVLEKIFNFKWWDYSDEKYNFRGYICLRFSMVWGVFALLLVQFAHPIVSSFLLNVEDDKKKYIGILILVYLLIDISNSVYEVIDLRKVFFKYANLPENYYYQKLRRYKRIFFAFPRLLLLNVEILNKDVRSVLNDRLDKIKDEVKNFFNQLY